MQIARNLIDVDDGFLCDKRYLIRQAIQRSRALPTEIASAWLGNLDPFLETIQAISYRDVVDRPLNLVQLMTIFDRYREMPERATNVCGKLVMLYLRDWNEQEGVIRRTKSTLINNLESRSSFRHATLPRVQCTVNSNVFDPGGEELAETEEDLRAGSTALISVRTLRSKNSINQSSKGKDT